MLFVGCWHEASRHRRGRQHSGDSSGADNKVGGAAHINRVRIESEYPLAARWYLYTQINMHARCTSEQLEKSR
jgi:hypothetical protein